MDTKKYIIDLPDNTAWLQWVKVADKDGNVYFDSKNPEDLTPYIEPDLDTVRNEAYQQGYKDGYNKYDTERIRKREYDKGLDDIGNALRLLLFQYSNYTLQKIFGYDTARAVVEHFEGSEIVARIRCYEGGVKQDAETIRKEAYDKGYQDAVMKIGSDEQAIAEKAYQRGLDDAWEAARQVSNMTLKTQKTIFDVDGTRYVVGKYTAQEVMERIKNYENEKPEEYKFTPGDEIVYKTDHSIRVCVTSVNVGSWDGFALADVEDVCTFGGSYLDRPFEDWEKTGRKVEILKKAKEEQT